MGKYFLSSESNNQNNRKHLKMKLNQSLQNQTKTKRPNLDLPSKYIKVGLDLSRICSSSNLTRMSSTQASLSL